MLLTLIAAVSMESNVTVFAAASLKDAFTEIAKKFEAQHSDSRVILNFAGSQTLAAQIAQGAPADVFASAARKNLLDAKPDMKTIRVFARNRLVIVFRSGFEATSPKDLSRVERLVVADDKVPAGRYGIQFLANAEREYGTGWRKVVDGKIASRELDVRSVLAKVKLGEADAGIVYYSDWFSARDSVRLIGIPSRLNVFADYPLAITSAPRNALGGKAFADYVLSKDGQSILKANGFMEAPQK